MAAPYGDHAIPSGMLGLSNDSVAGIEGVGARGTSMVTAVGWAFYLACSWTWVIGMLLPILLVRDFGWPGWLTFALPNVIGAAAMGWVLASRRQSRQFVADHSAMCVAFSTVTIAFQAFGIVWFGPKLLGGWAALAVGAVMLAALVPGGLRSLGGRWGATAVWMVSAGIAAWFLWGGVRLPSSTGIVDSYHLVGLAPATLLGFLLCPYLDLTFHRARQGNDAPRAKLAFGLGFGVLFLAMITLSLLYALPLAVLLNRSGSGAFPIIGVHLAVQASFTVLLHSLAVRQVREMSFGRPVPWAARLAPLAVAIGLLVGVLANYGDARGMLLSDAWTMGEVTYRGFLGFYGLLFPAYVLLVVAGRAPTRLFLVTVAAALPFYAVGFLWQFMLAAAVGTVLVMMGWLLALARARGGLPEEG